MHLVAGRPPTKSKLPSPVNKSTAGSDKEKPSAEPVGKPAEATPSDKNNKPVSPEPPVSLDKKATDASKKVWSRLYFNS